MSDKKLAIVTGASKGLGLAMATELYKKGFSLVTISRSNRISLAPDTNGKVQTFKHISADLSNTSGTDNAIKKLREALKPNIKQLILINNAGTVGPIANTSNLDNINEISQSFTLNVSSVMALTAVVLQHSTAHNISTRVLNISSGAGRNPMPGWGVYCATKAALDHYTRVLSAEHPEIKSVSLAPGVIDTDMQTTIRQSNEQDFPGLGNFIAMYEHGQLSSPESTAEKIISHLLSNVFGNSVIDDIRKY